MSATFCYAQTLEKIQKNIQYLLIVRISFSEFFVNLLMKKSIWLLVGIGSFGFFGRRCETSILCCH